MEEKEMEYILFNNNYMKWLKNILSEHYYVDDHDDKISENDYGLAQKIKYLYKMVEEYALSYDIYPTRFENYDMYYVSYADLVFFIYEGKVSYGCFNNTLTKKSLPQCISIEDVRNSKLNDLINSDDSIFSGLKDEIIELNRMGISQDIIYQFVKKLSPRVNEHDKGHVYKKVRRNNEKRKKINN